MCAEAGRGGSARRALFAALAYAALTIALTWPLARQLTRSVPSDFGDPLLNSWIVSWDAHHLLRALGGDPGAPAGYWHANIYYPHPYALAYSEHLTAQALQILPVYAITRNPLLCYNLLFLSTFVVSGLGMFLFARELTSSTAAAFVAGLAYAFAPYRFGAIPHLQVLSSAWMPFVLFGFRRFFATGRGAPLAGATAAWIAQNLSCSYYLIFFSPVVALYLAWEVSARRLWTDWRTLARLFIAGGAVVLATLPFVIPYFRLRQLGFMPRSLDETDHFAADVYGYLTADANLRVWGGIMRAWPKAEGWLFPGLTIAALSAIAIAAAWSDARLKARATHGEDDARQIVTIARGFSRALGFALLAASVVAVAILFGWSLHLPFLRITRFDRALLIVVSLAAIFLAVSPPARTTARSFMASPVGILAALTLFAVAMSFGPHIHSRGRLIDEENVYALFYDHVPGFDGLRVPARFGMIVALGLAALAAYGTAFIERRRRGGLLTLVAGALIVVESTAVPLPLNGNDTNYRQQDLVALPATVATGAATPPVYGFVAQLPASAVILELPFGEVAFEARYIFYSTAHWRRLVNGYSGGAPVEYGLLAEALRDLRRSPDRAWQALARSGATHAIVHEASYADGRGAEVGDWLRRHGARELASFGADRVFTLPPLSR